METHIPVYEAVELIRSLDEQEREDYFQEQLAHVKSVLEMPNGTLDESIARAAATLRGYDRILRKWQKKKGG